MTVIAIITILLACAGLSSCGITGKVAMPSTEKIVESSALKQIKIGAILPLSGPVAVYGTESQKGIQLAIEELNAEKGLNITAIYEDDKSLVSTAAVEAANKLTNIDKVDLVLTMVVEEAKPTMPIFREQKIPLVVMWDDNRYIKEGGEFVFSNGFSTEKTGERIADFAFNNLGLRNITIIRHEDSWAELISEAFKSRFEGLGGLIVYQESLAPDQPDFKTVITKAISKNPDGVYFPLLPPTSAQFLIQANQLGLNAVRFTGDAFTQDVIDAAGSSAEGIYLTNGYADSPETLTARYKQRFGTDPIDVTIFAAGYDGVKKIENALDGTSVKSVKDRLDEIFGPSHSASKVEKIFQIEKGRRVIVE